MARSAAAISAIPPPISASTRIAALKHGIYAVRVGRGAERFDGVASFGRRPTFDNGAPLLEVFLFDFKGDLYGTMLDVAFIAFIRDELKFDGIEALVRQMDDDSAAGPRGAGGSAGCVSEARSDRIEQDRKAKDARGRTRIAPRCRNRRRAGGRPRHGWCVTTRRWRSRCRSGTRCCANASAHVGEDAVIRPPFFCIRC